MAHFFLWPHLSDLSEFVSNFTIEGWILPAGSKLVPLVCKRTWFLPLRDMAVRYPMCYRCMRCPLSSKLTWLAGKSTVEYRTPQKSNIDTKNGHILKESTFSKPSFWVSMLVFRTCRCFPSQRAGVWCFWFQATECLCLPGAVTTRCGRPGS